MAYNFYLNKMLCPVAPSKLQIKIKNNNKTISLINEGEANILKKAGLTEISLDLLLPNVRYPFAKYKNGFKRADYFLEYIEKLKVNKKPFQFIVTRELPNRRRLFNTNISVSLEEYQISEESSAGFDVSVSIKLKQYRSFGTKTCTIKFADSKPRLNIQNNRPASNPPQPQGNSRTYTVVSGDCLWNIAKRFYGNGSRYPDIFNANKDKISNPNLIYPGQVLVIP